MNNAGHMPHSKPQSRQVAALWYGCPRGDLQFKLAVARELFEIQNKLGPHGFMAGHAPVGQAAGGCFCLGIGKFLGAFAGDNRLGQCPTGCFQVHLDLCGRHLERSAVRPHHVTVPM